MLSFQFLFDESHNFFFDKIFFHILFLEFLHEEIVVLNLDIHFFKSSPKSSNLFSIFFVLIEERVSLRLKVVKLVVQFPDLILGVLLGNRLVKFEDDLACLFPHLFNFILYEEEDLVLMVFEPSRYVFIDSVDDTVYLPEMEVDGLF
jgi:hypothetical protein